MSETKKPLLAEALGKEVGEVFVFTGGGRSAHIASAKTGGWQLPLRLWMQARQHCLKLSICGCSGCSRNKGKEATNEREGSE